MALFGSYYGILSGGKSLFTPSAPSTDATIKAAASTPDGVALFKLNTTQAISLQGHGVSAGLFASVVEIASDYSLTIGTEATLESSGTYLGTSLRQWGAALSTSKGVALYSPSAGQVYARVLDVSGTGITVGSALTVSASAGQFATGICPLDSTHLLAAYNNQNIVVLTESSSTLSAGTPITLGTTNSIAWDGAVCRLVQLSSNKAMAISVAGTACVITVSGTTPTQGNNFTFNGGTDNNLLEAVALDSTHVLIVYEETNSSVLARVLKVDGSNNITESSEYTVITGNGNSYHSFVGMMNANRALIGSIFDKATDGIDMRAVGINDTVMDITSGALTSILNCPYGGSYAFFTGLTQAKAIVSYIDGSGNLLARGVKLA